MSIKGPKQQRGYLHTRLHFLTKLFVFFQLVERADSVLVTSAVQKINNLQAKKECKLSKSIK
jgi:hypothetical protein